MRKKMVSLELYSARKDKRGNGSRRPMSRKLDKNCTLSWLSGLGYIIIHHIQKLAFGVGCRLSGYQSYLKNLISNIAFTPQTIQSLPGKQIARWSVSLIIFLLVCVSVTFQAGYLINKSFKQDNNAILLSQTIKHGKPAVLALDEENIAGITSDYSSDCVLLSPNTSPDSNSLVDFLVANQIAASFEYRLVLARQVNIENYTGTAEQNLQILTRLKENSICITK